MAKITVSKRKERETITVKTKTSAQPMGGVVQWWNAKSKEERCRQMLSCAVFLKEKQQYRYRQAAIYSGLYSNNPMSSWIGSNISKIRTSNMLPLDRPTMNVIQSCADTLVSRITQAKPRPVFLTDNADYKKRNFAKQLNYFTQGEFYQTKAYELGERALLDAITLGTGCLKVYETQGRKVGLDRCLETEFLIDENDGFFGFPRTLYQIQLVDREVLEADYPTERSTINKAEQAYPDNSADAQRSISDQVMVVEAWHLPSHPEANDGLHVIGCTSGTILEEPFTKNRFPVVWLNYSRRMVGFWGQGLSEQLLGTQVEINKLLITIANAINIVGVPRVFVEDGSKVVSAHLNNQIGSIIKYRGTKPIYEVAPCMPGEVYAQLQRLIDYAYQQSGISALAAASQKPAGLDSGAALREYDDLQSDRFASLVKRYDHMYIDLAYLMLDKGRDIAERDGKYLTVYPGKDSIRKVELPDVKELEDDPFIIQAFDSSSLPRDPAGRMQRIVEMIQSGMISVQEGRRLLDYPDLNQVNMLANAGEERILKYLDQIVEDGKYTPPDPFMDLGLADELCTQYYNLYVGAGLEKSKASKLRNWSVQVKNLKMAAMPQAMPGQGPALQPQAAPQAQPVSDMIQNVPGQAA